MGDEHDGQPTGNQASVVGDCALEISGPSADGGGPDGDASVVHRHGREQFPKSGGDRL